MNQGKSLIELAEELTRQKDNKKDFIADTRQMRMDPAGDTLHLEGKENTYSVANLAHQQIANWCDIPARYYNKMQSNSPALLAGNVNHWLHHPQKTTRRMIRTLDGNARAFLSSRYRRLDNEHVAEAALPVLLENEGQMSVVSSEVTDKRLYIKALFPRVEGEVKQGDLVQAGVVISNSEVGCGALTVAPLIYRLVCTNGMIADASGDFSLNKYHVGRQVAGDDVSYEVYRDATMQADDKAVLMKLQDTIRAAADPAIFETLLNQMREATLGDKVQTPIKAVDVLGKTFGLSEDERGSVLENLIRGGDYSRWGTLNAVTEIANSLDDYERSTELENVGGRILTLPRNQWEHIAQAA